MVVWVGLVVAVILMVLSLSWFVGNQLGTLLLVVQGRDSIDNIWVFYKERQSLRSIPGGMIGVAGNGHRGRAEPVF